MTRAEPEKRSGRTGEPQSKAGSRPSCGTDSERPGALSADERAELEALRKENKDLRMDREILRKAAAYFARETNR